MKPKTNRNLILAGLSAIAIVGVATAQDHTIQAVIGNVFLQNTTPGISQVGHATITGTFRAGQVFVQQGNAATVDCDFKDAPIHDLLRTIADTGRVNIVVPDGIDAKVTVRLKRVPWDQALEVILASHGLWYRRR